MPCVEVEIKYELRTWQLEKMRVGLQQAQTGCVTSENEVSKIFVKYKNKFINSYLIG